MRIKTLIQLASTVTIVLEPILVLSLTEPASWKWSLEVDDAQRLEGLRRPIG